MKSLFMRYSPDGKHQVCDGGAVLGEIDSTRLKRYVETYVGAEPAKQVSAAEAHLNSLIETRMSECKETREAAEQAIIHTTKGLQLWEEARALRLAESGRS